MLGCVAVCGRKAEVNGREHVCACVCVYVHVCVYVYVCMCVCGGGAAVPRVVV